ncbi:type II secretion system secretin GspD [Thioalkalivibrio sulfidiphilus]|uniref:type II secretion system secretin GspD n=1 Tax=Thioalkalivibrio sulfidiphilus TaxID=1033854 RepID=UPI000364127A|nr:type II secretion system secretin GspD [Thioalkalivibrio sulfidiphilus]
MRPWLGRVVILLALWLAQPALAQENDTVVLNFKEADIQALISMVSEQTGTNFVVDPRVRGRVTVISGAPVKREELYRIFLSVLRIHGFAAVPGDGVVKLIPEVQAKQTEVPTVAPPRVGTGDEYVTRVIKVDHVDAAQLVPILRPLVPQSGHLVASAESNVLIVSDSAANAQRIAELVARIDLDGREDMEMIPLRHASAAEVVRVLTSLHSGEGRRGQVQMVADERTNSILLGGDPKRRVAIRAMISHLDTRIEGGNAQVIYLRYANAPDMAEVLKGLVAGMDLPGGEARDGRGPGGVNIQAHESTNALVINGPPDVVRDLRAVIQQLDVRRAQVLVEAVIAEVSYDKVAELGVQWGVGNPNSGVGVINFNRSGSGIIGVAGGIDAFLRGAVATPPNLGDGAFLGGIGTSGSTTIAALLRALAGDSSSNILSTPSLMTLDNEEAEIVVGQNVPFIAGRSIEQSGQAFDTIQRQDVGVKLRIKPQINEGNSIRLEIEQEVSQVAAGATAAADLVTNKRSLRTIVMVDDGEMVVLGGLIDDVLVQTQDRVPGLGSIPGVGRLFRYDTARKEKRNLMVFLHPVIVRDVDTNQRLTESKYSYIRAQQLDARERGALFMSRDVAPVLPPWEELLSLPPPYEAVSAPATGNTIDVRPPPARP